MFRKIILFISSYIPLYLLMIIKNILERTTDKGRFLNVLNRKIILFDEINDYAVVFFFFLCLISFVYLKLKIKNTVGKKHYKIKTVENETSNYYFNYISIYLLSCLGLTLNNIVDVFVFLFLMIIVGFIYISNRMTYMNPTLNLLGYKVYNTELKLESMSTEKTFKSIVIAPKEVIIKVGAEIIATGKQDFIFAKNGIEDS
jgi:hypothetical protein